MTRLDKRRQRSQGKRGNFREKGRVLGTPSTLPRQSAPKWAIRQGTLDHNSEEEMESPDEEEEESSDSMTFSD